MADDANGLTSGMSLYPHSPSFRLTNYSHADSSGFTDGYTFYSHSLSPLTSYNPFTDRLMQIGRKNSKSLEKLPIPIALADTILLLYTEKNGVHCFLLWNF